MVLVTGGSGLVGSELIAQLLQQGKRVRAIYNQTPLPAFSSSLIQTQHCDILDTLELESVMRDVEQVYHCAGIVTFTKKHQQKLARINIEGTANVVNAALDAGVKKMVFVSSVSALGTRRGNSIIDETLNWTDKTSSSFYAKTKFLAEMEAWRGIAEGLNVVIVNPSVILGPGNWNSGSSQVFKTYYNGFNWYSDGITGFVDVRDVAKAMIELMDSNINAERFIISADNKSFEDVFKMIAKGFEKKPPQKKITPLLAQLVWRMEAVKSFFNGKQPLITKETADAALAKVYFDNSKMKKNLPGFNYMPLEQTIRDTCKTLLQQHNNH